MVRIPFLLILCAGLWPSLRAAALTLAIVDRPVDYSHREIAPFVDLETLRTTRYYGPLGGSRSWYEINQACLTTEIADAARGHSDEWLHLALEYTHLRSLLGAGIQRGLPASVNEANRQRIAFLESLGIQRLPDLGLVHGTHVASILLEDLRPGDPVQLLNFPPPSIENMALAVFNHGQDFGELLRFYFTSLSGALQKANVRVVNLSWVFSPENMEDYFRTLLAKGEVPSEYLGEVNAFVDQVVSVYYREFETFLAQNPETLFVFAIGNDHKDLKNDGRLLLKLPNTLFVGAEDRAGLPADFSNYGHALVDLFAPGDAVAAAAAGTGDREIFLSGTSMAAPKVGKRLRNLLLENPALPTIPLRARLINEESMADPLFVGLSSGARHLRFRVAFDLHPSTCASLLDRSPAHARTQFRLKSRSAMN